MGIIMRRREDRIERWKSKEMHGRLFKELNDDGVDKRISDEWLRTGNLYAETEGFVIAIQDQVVPTRNYRQIILNESEVEDKCRKCSGKGESIQHLLNGCPSLAATEYKARHDAAGKILHQKIVQKVVKKNESRVPYYQYEPKAIIEEGDYKVYWDRTIRKDKEEIHNRSDIIVHNKAKKKVQLIDITIPLSTNMKNTYNEKKRKYEEELARQSGECGRWKRRRSSR